MFVINELFRAESGKDLGNKAVFDDLKIGSTVKDVVTVLEDLPDIKAVSRYLAKTGTLAQEVPASD